jgi:hypothetical protein
MYNFREIYEAILAANPSPDSFLFDRAALPRLGETNYLQELVTEAREVAHNAHQTPIPALPFSAFRLFETTGNRTEYETAYFERRGRLIGLAVTNLIDNTDEHIVTLENLVWEICNEYTWAVPAHLPVGLKANLAHRLPPEQMVDLFAAETADALAELLVLFKDRLNPWLDYRIRSEIERRVFAPMFDTSTHFGWEAANHNWAAVCCGNVGMAALLLVDDRQRLAGIIERVVRALECFLSGYGDDGGCPEGIAYWTYGFGYYVYFAQMLYDFTGGKLDLLAGEKIRRIAEFPAAVNFTGASFVNFSDAPDQIELPPGLMSQLGQRLNLIMPQVTGSAGLYDMVGRKRFRWAHTFRNIFWTKPAFLNKHLPDAISFFPDLQWVIDRRGGDLGFAAKGGHNNEPHNHNDLGQFILHLNGENLLADLGAGLYVRDYFHGDRYSFLHAGSQGHNVPVVNGQFQAGGMHYAAKVLRYEPHPNGLDFELDLTGAYPEAAGLMSFRRKFGWQVENNTGRLELIDIFRFEDAPGSLEEIFISLHQPEVQPNQVVWRGSNGTATLSFDQNEFAPTVETIPSQSHSGQDITVYRLRLRALRPASETSCRLVFSCQTGEQ